MASTRWTLVRLAGAEDSPEARAALEELCRGYWTALYAYARQLGHQDADARDLTQAFFARFLERGYIRAADPERGRFRTFLRTCFKHFTQTEWERARAARRGGKLRVLSWDELPQPGIPEPTAGESPERAYDRVWALRCFAQAIERLAKEQDAGGRSRDYAVLRRFLSQSGDAATYEAAGNELGCSGNAVAIAVSRLRRRLRELVRDEVAQTVLRPEDIDGELRYLRDLIAG